MQMQMPMPMAMPQQQQPPRPAQQPQQPAGDVYYMDMNSAKPQGAPAQQNQPGQQGVDPSMMFLQKKIRESKHT